jgi:hypothetical protein
MADIKDLLNDIIHNTDNSYTDTSGKKPENPNVQYFDKGQFREKLSMNVLKDIICAMMHDETKDLDGMIDAAIMRHINDNYGGSCHCYLKSCCDKLKSPILGNIIQEIEEKCNCVAQEACETKDPKSAEKKIDTKEMLRNVEHYGELRDRIKNEVSQKVVEDVSKVIVNSNQAPTFDKLDEKLEKKKKDDNEDKQNKPLSDDIATESVIMRMCGAIVTESAMNKAPITTEEGLNRAIVEYCIVQMDALFKQYNNSDGFTRYLK